MELMKNTRNIGLRALMDVTEIQSQNIKPYTIGFVLGPCLNATGRLDTATNALELFSKQHYILFWKGKSCCKLMSAILCEKLLALCHLIIHGVRFNRTSGTFDPAIHSTGPVRDVHPLSAHIIGKNRNVLKLQLENGRGGSMDAVYFGDIEQFLYF